MYRIHSRRFLILWIMSTIMLTTAFMPLGLSADSGPFLLGSAWLIMCGCYFYRVPLGRMAYGYKLFLFIIFLSLTLGMMKNYFATNGDLNIYMWNLLIKAFPKILFLILIYFLISNIDDISVIKISNRFVIIFIATIGLSLIAYQLFPIHRFVWYASRFAAFHYELVNFSFTAFAAGIILIYSKIKNGIAIYFWVAVLSALIYIVSKSNYVPLFIATVVYSVVLVKAPTRLKSTLCLSYFTILIGILLLLPSLLEYVEKLLFLFPRTTETLQDDSSPIWIRLHRHIFAMQYFFDNLFSLPNGFFNGGFDADLAKLAFGSWTGGSGLSKLFMDFGLLIIPFLILLIGTFLKVLKTMDPENRRDQMYFILANLCFSYGYLQAGFFNFTSVTLFLLSLKYWKLI